MTALDPRLSDASDRTAEIERFLASAGWKGARVAALAGDASFRRYHRADGPKGTALVMDVPRHAPPPQNDLVPYLRVARMLQAIDLSAPSILAVDAPAGLALIEDFGETTFNRALARGTNERGLYELAVDTLIALHRRYRPRDTLQPFTPARGTAEAELLLDWYLPALTGSPVAEAARTDFRAAWRRAFEAVASIPTSLALFDYHIDNLMLLADRPGVRACGLLDFQDAVHAPIVFDLVSLIEDARRDVPPSLGRALIERYLAAFPALDPSAFHAAYAVIGAQRNTRILGTFVRLDRLYGKPAYLAHVPRLWRWLEGDLAHPALGDLARWFDRHVPAGARRAPASAPGSA